MTTSNDPLILLSRWLSNPNDNSGFTAYYKVIVKSLQLNKLIVGKLYKIRSYLNCDLEEAANDILQDLMIKHIHQLGKDRVEAAVGIEKLLTSLKPPDREELYVKQVEAWRGDFKNWHTAIAPFYKNCAEDRELKTDWHHQADQLDETWLKLRKAGVLLLKRAADHFEQESCSEEISNSDNDIDDVETHSFGIENEADAHLEAQIKTLVNTVIKRIKKEGVEQVDHALGFTGSSEFICAVHQLIKLGNKVRVFKSYYLLTQATQLIIDYQKKRSIQFEMTVLDKGENVGDKPDLLKTEDIEDEMNSSAIEIVELIQEIEYLLSAPWRQSLGSIRAVKNKADKLHAEVKQKKLKLRFELMKSVLELHILGDSQEKIGTSLGITREQVRGLWHDIKELLKSLDK